MGGVVALQAIKRANDTEYGLASGVFTNDLDLYNIIARNLKVSALIVAETAYASELCREPNVGGLWGQAGTVWVNCYNGAHRSPGMLVPIPPCCKCCYDCNKVLRGDVEVKRMFARRAGMLCDASNPFRAYTPLDRR